MTGEFPASMASNAENVPIWWRHHEYFRATCLTPPDPIIFLIAEPDPASTIACDFEPGSMCGYSDISIHNMAKWECVDIDEVRNISGDIAYVFPATDAVSIA